MTRREKGFRGKMDAEHEFRKSKATYTSVRSKRDESSASRALYFREDDPCGVGVESWLVTRGAETCAKLEGDGRVETRY